MVAPAMSSLAWRPAARVRQASPGLTVRQTLNSAPWDTVRTMERVPMVEAQRLHVNAKMALEVRDAKLTYCSARPILVSMTEHVWRAMGPLYTASACLTSPALTAALSSSLVSFRCTFTVEDVYRHALRDALE